VYVLKGGIPESPPEDTPVDTPQTGQSAAEVTSIDSFAQSALHNEELASLHAENEKLRAEIKEYQLSEARMREQIAQQRDELCELGEKLDSLYAQAKSDA